MALFIFASCEKEKDDENNNDQDALADTEMMKTSAQIDYVNEADFKMSTEAISSQDSYSPDENPASSMSACADITLETGDDNGFPRILTIDFGEGCTHNGVLRTGVLVLTLNDYLMNNGSELTIERENYTINGIQVEGTVTYINETTNPDMPTWERTVEDGSITNLQDQTFTHSGNRTVTMIEGFGNLDLTDNVYEISSGTHTVNRPNGSSLTVTVEEPLIKAYSCEYIQQGVLYLDGTLLDGDLNYGNGDCDNEATYTHSNGQTYNINL